MSFAFMMFSLKTCLSLSLLKLRFCFNVVFNVDISEDLYYWGLC